MLTETKDLRWVNDIRINLFIPFNKADQHMLCNI